MALPSFEIGCVFSLAKVRGMYLSLASEFVHNYISRTHWPGTLISESHPVAACNTMNCRRRVGGHP